MEKQLLNGKLEVTCPDGFEIMGLDEVEKLYGIEYPDMWGMRDEDRHVIFTIVWKNSNKLLAKIVSAKTVVEQNEQKLRKTLKTNEYHCDEFFKTQVAGTEAQGLRYSYTLEERSMIGEIIVVKNDITCYTIYYYSRVENAEQNRAVYEDILASLRFV